MKPHEAWGIIVRCGAYLSGGHYKLVGGDHTDEYVHLRIVLLDKAYRDAFARSILEKFNDTKITAIASFSKAGNLLAEAVRDTLVSSGVFVKLLTGRRRRIDSSQDLIIEGLENLKQDDNVLVVSTVVTTGSSIQDAIHSIERNSPATVVGAGVILERRPGLSIGGRSGVVRLRSIVTRQMSLWKTGECPLDDIYGDPEDLGDPDENPIPLIRSVAKTSTLNLNHLIVAEASNARHNRRRQLILASIGWLLSIVRLIIDFLLRIK